MTNEQIEEFCKKQSEAEVMEIKSKMLHHEAETLVSKNRQSCDHRLPSGKIAGMEFQGSYCGFTCQICGCGVSYERMGY